MRLSKVALFVCVPSCLALLPMSLPARALAQAPPSTRTGLYVGGSIGRYLEASEGGGGSAAVRAITLGYHFNPRWGIRGEFASTGDVCDQRTARCHRDQLFTLSAVRRFTGDRRSFYLLFGLVPHAGFGMSVPLGPRLTVSTEFDVVYSIYAIAARLKVGFALHL